MEDTETIVKVLNILWKSPETSQRDIAESVGISVGKANYVLKSLTAKGLVKTENFLNSKNKWAYKYILTPKGIKSKMKITKDFINRKFEEYEVLLSEQ